MLGLKRLTQADSLWKAIKSVWQAGLESYSKQATLQELKAAQKRLSEELLEMSQLVHEYETKILNTVRENQRLGRENKEFERVYQILRRENRMLKEEIFKFKGKPFS